MEPVNEAGLVAAIERVANSRQRSLLVVDLKRSIASARHKLNIVMYQAALICEVNTDDFQRLKVAADEGQLPSNPSHIEYKGCSYDLQDFYHYRLLLSFFLESFAAANFSLLDVIGRLLNDLYDLGRQADRTSYKRAVDDILQRRSGSSDPVLQLLSRYYVRLNDPSMPTWMPPLEEMRHRTTHRPITDICFVHSQSTLYPEIDGSTAAFYLNRDLFSSADDVLLCKFVEEVFEGIQLFVEELYDLLRQTADAQGSLPLS